MAASYDSRIASLEETRADELRNAKKKYDHLQAIYAALVTEYEDLMCMYCERKCAHGACRAWPDELYLTVSGEVLHTSRTCDAINGLPDRRVKTRRRCLVCD